METCMHILSLGSVNILHTHPVNPREGNVKPASSKVSTSQTIDRNPGDRGKIELMILQQTM